MEISTCVKYVGVNDHQVDLFEGQYKVRMECLTILCDPG